MWGSWGMLCKQEQLLLRHLPILGLALFLSKCGLN